MRVNRTKSIDTEWLSPEQVSFTSSLRDVATLDDPPGGLDVVHDIAVNGRISIDTMVLSEVAPMATVLPYGECRIAMSKVERLSGLRLDSSYRPAILELMGRTRGCSHFLTICLELAQMRTMVGYGRIRRQFPHGRRTDPEWLGSDPALENACFALRSESPVIADARQLWRSPDV